MPVLFLGHSLFMAFPLTRQQYDGPDGLELLYWLWTPERVSPVVVRGERAVCFIPTAQQVQAQQTLTALPSDEWELVELPLKNLQQQPVSALYVSTLASYYRAIELLQADAIALMEEDIRPVDRYLMERFIGVSAKSYERQGRLALTAVPDEQARHFTPQFKTLSLDLETTLKADRIHSAGLQVCQGGEVLLERVLLVTTSPEVEQQVVEPWIEHCRTEAQLLQRLVQFIAQHDPDLIIGWNVIGFDLRVLMQRFEAYRIAPNLGRSLGKDQGRMLVEQGQAGRWYARIPGRVVLDGVETLKGATWHFERYGLEFVAQALLGRGKAIDHPEDRGLEIQRLYAQEPRALAFYNLEDCRLVTEIFQKAQLLEYLIERSRLTCLALDKVGGSQQAFDNLYLPQLHRRGYVAPEYASGRSDLEIPGGFVMESQPGLYRDVLVLDFKSLYPSIIRTFQVDPLGLAAGLLEGADPNNLVPGFNGATFDRSQTLLPNIIEQLWRARDEAKKQGNSALSQAIKIQMNACYGVLGSKVCRFFDQRLSGSITLRGHQILQQTAAYIEAQFGHQVIYGDTDSVFVHIANAAQDSSTLAGYATLSDYGAALVQQINHWWREQLQSRFQIESCLELQFEAHYSRFLMPRMRHSEKGSKKRYAGLKVKGYSHAGEITATELVFKGLESVRTDWSLLARDFQQALYARIFHDQPYEQLLQQTLAQLYAGELDAQLVYHRRLRRPLESYTRAQPPHVKAARLAEQIRQQHQLPPLYQRGDSVRYLITVNGAEPLEYQRSPIDYQHYVDKQLRPVADAILPFLGVQFDDLAAPQLGLF